MHTTYQRPQVIAEIGCNHKGDMTIAKELIYLAKKSGADIAKFQKRNNKELLTPEQYNAPHPNPKHSYGATYGEHREFLEFDVAQHRELQLYAHKLGIIYSTSVWDKTSAQEILALNPPMLKVPSACNTNFALLEVLRDDYTGDIHISLGMSTQKEIATLIAFFQEKQKTHHLVLYACTSGYPIAYDDVCLLEIRRIYEQYGHIIKAVGYSGHHLGINVDMAAFTLGASYIERHFTKDKTWKGTDHSASLEPSELTDLIAGLTEVYASLTYKPTELLDIEIPQRKKLKFGCFRQ